MANRMTKDAWPLKMIMAVVAFFIGASDSTFGPPTMSAGVLLLVGFLLFMEALSDRAICKVRVEEKFRKWQPLPGADPSPTGQNHPNVDTRPVAERIANAKQRIARAKRALARTDISAEQRASAERVRAGYSILLEGWLDRQTSECNQLPDSPMDFGKGHD